MKKRKVISEAQLCRLVYECACDILMEGANFDVNKAAHGDVNHAVGRIKALLKGAPGTRTSKYRERHDRAYSNLDPLEKRLYANPYREYLGYGENQKKKGDMESLRKSIKEGGQRIRFKNEYGQIFYIDEDDNVFDEYGILLTSRPPMMGDDGRTPFGREPRKEK